MESATASCVVAVPEPIAAVPGPGSEVPGPGATVAVPESPAEDPWPAGAAPESDSTIPGAAGMKMDSDFGEGLIDGLQRYWRETPAGISWRVEPIHGRASACSLLARDT